MNYALITPARNEAAFVVGVIKAMVSQTVKPVKWVIVSDGSTDGTDDIVQGYTDQFSWIELVRTPDRRERHFAGKVQAFNAGYTRLKDLDYDIIGNLDADLTFDPDYFSFLLSKFQLFPKLGVAGTPFVEDPSRPSHHSYAGKFANLDHVSGGCQIFRRRCFEDVGGYTPVKGGGIDWIAVTTARMKGWQTRTFLEKTCVHHRKMGTAGSGPLRARFRHGQEDYYVGHHPLWELLRCLFQMKESPVLFGGLSLICGYTWSWLRRVERPVSAELIAFHRGEQMARLRRLLHLPTARPDAQSCDEGRNASGC